MTADADPDDMTGGPFASYAPAGTYTGTPLVYETDYDLLSRVHKARAPAPRSGVVESEWVYEYRTVRNPSELDRWAIPYTTVTALPPRIGLTEFAGPVRVTTVSAAGTMLTASDYTPNASATYPDVDDVLDGQTELARTRMDWTLSGMLRATTAWNDVDGSMGRPTDLRSYVTTYEYDERGRQTRSTTSDGEVYEQEFDVLGRAVKRYRGASVSDLELLVEYFFDSPSSTPAQGVGNGNLRFTVFHTGEGSATRTVENKYDWRGRVVAVQNALPPHQLYVYDNLGRVTESASFSSSTAPTSNNATDRISWQQYFYSQRGVPFRSRVAIDPSNGSTGFLESNVWHDVSGRTIASSSPDSPGSKTTYDTLGRVLATYSTNRGGDVASGSGSYETAATLDDDLVLSQTTYHYADFGAVDFVRSFVRRHDASETTDGPLTLNTGLVDPDLAVASYVGHFYDDVGRLSRTVNFGTNKAPNASDRLGDSFSNGTSPESTWLAVTTRPEHNTSGTVIAAGRSLGLKGFADRITNQLQNIARRAAKEFESTGFTPRQLKAIARRPGLEPAYKGSQIDTIFKRIVGDEMPGLEVTPRFKRGPDVIDPETGRWWDLTTPGQWPNHVKKYGPDGTPIYYNKTCGAGS